jgi:hypothetical protein
MTDFTRQQVKQLRLLMARQPAHAGEKTPEGFLLRYVFFEAATKTVGKYYRESIGREKKVIAATKEVLQLPLVQKWLEHFAIKVHPEQLKLILDSSLKRRDNKSARELRNGLVHQWSEKDAEEVISRFKVLDRALVSVISAIDKAAKTA